MPDATQWNAAAEREMASPRERKVFKLVRRAAVVPLDTSGSSRSGSLNGRPTELPQRTSGCSRLTIQYVASNDN